MFLAGRGGGGGGGVGKGLESVVVGTIGKRTLICTVRWRAGMRRGGEEGTCVRRGVVLFSLLCVFCFVVSLAHRRSLAPLPPPPPLLLFVVDFPCYHFNFLVTILLVCFSFFPLSAGFFRSAQRFSERGVYLRLKKGERLSSSCVCVFFWSIIAMPTEVSPNRCLLF
jgi:hypothetical protein